jgi:hypothetical protein
MKFWVIPPTYIYPLLLKTVILSISNNFVAHDKDMVEALRDKMCSVGDKAFSPGKAQSCECKASSLLAETVNQVFHSETAYELAHQELKVDLRILSLVMPRLSDRLTTITSDVLQFNRPISCHASLFVCILILKKVYYFKSYDCYTVSKVS